MMHRIFAFVLCLVFVYGGAFAPAVAQKRPIPVLIVDGFSNHDWKQTTVVTKWILEASGLFTVHVSTIPSDSIQRSTGRQSLKITRL